VTASVGGVAATVTVVATRGATGGRSEGDRVKAKCTGWTKYYAGEITRVNSDGTYDIKFEDGERKQGVTEDQIEGGGGDRDRGRDSRSSTKTRREGDTIKAKCTGWTKYYAGEITRVNSDGTYDIKFEDGERKRGIKEDQIEGGGGDRESRTSTSTRSEGDRVKAKCSGWTKYYAGEITRVNSDGTYDIKFEDGERKRGIQEDQIEGGGGGDGVQVFLGGSCNPTTWREDYAVGSLRPTYR
jgi:uncharacterized protein YaiE (UPF0345 family)